MLVIKLSEDKELQITVDSPIYRGENIENGIMFLVSKTIGPIQDVANAKLYLTYLRPDGVAEMVWLYEHSEYSDGYYQFMMPANRKFTRVQGQVTVWFQIYDTGACVKPIILKSNEVLINVLPAKDGSDYVDDDTLSLVYSVQKGMEAHVQEKIDELSAKKADNISYNAEDKSLHLSADGEDIGEPLKVEEFVPAGIDRMWVSGSGNLWITYTNGQSVNVGHVVGPEGPVGSHGPRGETGGVWYPSVSEEGEISWKLDSGVEPVATNIKGDPGKDGVWYTPSVSPDGVLSWTLGSRVPPGTANIKGQQGDRGEKGERGPEGKQGKVVVPTIDGKKILRWSIEDDVSQVPDPVDLNPNDEWNAVSGVGKMSDYNWQGLN